MASQIQFCKSADGTRLGFATMGKNPGLPLLYVQGVGGSVENPYWSDFYAELASRKRLIVFDRRGGGISDGGVQRLGVDAQMEDITAVTRFLQIDSFDLWGHYDGAGVAAAYAAQHPDQVSRLVLFSGFASGPRHARQGAVEGFTTLVRSNWRMARRAVADLTFPSGPSEDRELTAEGLKAALTPEDAASAFEEFWKLDVTDDLKRVQCPTLILHRRASSLIPVSAAREMASLIPDARLVLLEGDVSAASYNFRQYIDTVWEFLGDPVPAASGGAIGVDKLLDLMAGDQDNWQTQKYVPASGNEAGRNTLRTVLFTDLVGHTEMMSRLGDEKGREVLREHERITRGVLKAHGGTEVKTMGDGFMASFGSVTKAVECAVALQKAFADREGEPLSVRVGLNAGEPIEENGDLFGATVILASRIAAKADGGEILVSDNVRSLCSGKGFLFADRGDFVAKGFEEPIRVYEVSWRDDS